MKLNFFEMWNLHIILQIKQPFNIWLKQFKQGKIKIEGEYENDGMYNYTGDTPANFEAWLKVHRGAKR